MESWIFSMITPVFSVTWSFRNHSNLLLKKHLLLCVENSCAVPCFCGNRDIQYFIFQDSLMNRKFKRTALIWIEIFCEVIIVFHVIFDQFNASLMKESINFCKHFTDPKLLNSRVRHIWLRCSQRRHISRRDLRPSDLWPRVGYRSRYF